MDFVIYLECPETEFMVIMAVLLSSYEILDVLWLTSPNPNDLKARINLKPKL